MCIKKDSKHIVDAYYLLIRKPEHKNKPNNTHKLIFTEVQPIYDGRRFKINFTYDTDKNKNKPVVGKYISIDLGMKNLMTIYNPNGHQYIIKGSMISSINHYFNRKIDSLKSKLSSNKKSTNNAYQSYWGKNVHIFDVLNGNNTNCKPIRDTRKHPFNVMMNSQMESVLTDNYQKPKNTGKKTSDQIRKLFVKRENKINDCFNKIVKWIVDKYRDCEKIIVGYNEGWKKNVNMGKANNRDFYEIPYRKLLTKLRDKLEESNQKLVITEESYTSKCDALTLEPVNKQNKYTGKRIKRGLFSSGIKKLINADLNGAINILRKYLTKEQMPLKEVTGKGIYNPRRVNILTKH
jgi:IS605 OrfB family transposase